MWYPAVVVTLLLAAVLVLTGCQTQLIFPGSWMQGPSAQIDRPDGAQSLWVEHVHGRTEAWVFLAETQDDDHASPRPAVIFGHGNNELIDRNIELADWYNARGIHALIPEYRGYGRSDGSPSEKTINEDLVRFYDLLAGMPQVDQARIFFHGRSIGGGVVCRLARDRKPSAMILESTFTSVAAMARRYFAPSFLVRSPYRNDEFLSTYSGPVLFGHGDADPVIPLEHTRRNAANTENARFVVIPGAGHNDMYDRPVWRHVMHDFLTELGYIEAPQP